MITNDKGLVPFKHKVVEEVVRLAWNRELTADALEKLVYELVPGPKARWRCCVYKEREIVRQRIRLACGKAAEGRHVNADSIIQVIEAACEECPISSYTVTDNCRLCIGKSCMEACKFDAISIGSGRSYIDPSKCRECGQCAEACPYNAIAHLVRPCKKVCPVNAITYDEYGVCVIDEEKCISCGSCIHGCPFGAVGSKIFLVDIVEAILSGKEVYALAAPATEGQYGENITMASVRQACRELGFTDMIEVGLGADMTAACESEEWMEAYKEGKKMTTSCCPAFIQLLKKHFPQVYENNMSDTVSPMCAVSRYLKAVHPGCVTVFIGPCIAKKAETQDKSVAGNADFAITYGEFTSLMDSKGVTLKPVEEDYQEATLYGKKFASSGGVSDAVIQCMKERGENVSNIRVRKAAGGIECKTAAQLIKIGRLPEDFVEAMICPSGCVGGPSKHTAEKLVMKAREKMFSKAEDRKVLDNLKNYPMDSFSMSRRDK